MNNDLNYIFYNNLIFKDDISLILMKNIFKRKSKKIDNRIIEDAINLLIDLRKHTKFLHTLTPEDNFLHEVINDELEYLFPDLKQDNVSANTFDSLLFWRDKKLDYKAIMKELNAGTQRRVNYTLDVGMLVRSLNSLENILDKMNLPPILNNYPGTVERIKEMVSAIKKDRGSFREFEKQEVSLCNETAAKLIYHSNEDNPPTTPDWVFQSYQKKKTPFWKKLVIGGLVATLLVGAGVYNRRAGDTPQNSQSVAKKSELNVSNPKNFVDEIFPLTSENSNKKGNSDIYVIVGPGQNMTSITENFLKSLGIKWTGEDVYRAVDCVSLENDKDPQRKWVNPDGTPIMTPSPKNPNLLPVGYRLKVTGLYENAIKELPPEVIPEQLNIREDLTLNSERSPEDFYSNLFNNKYLPARNFNGSLSDFKRDLEGIVDSYNNGEIKTDYAGLSTKQDVYGFLNFERYKRIEQGYNPSEGPYLKRFNYNLLSDAERENLVSLYNDKSLSVAKVKQRFEEATQMKMSISSLYRTLDKQEGIQKRRCKQNKVGNV